MKAERWLPALHAPQEDLRDQAGQTLAEYSVVLSVISLGIIAALSVLSGSVTGSIQTVASLFG